MAINAKPRGFMFDEVEFSTPDKSAFDLSQRKLGTYQMDYLYPIFTHHCLPGETYEMNASVFFRTTPLTSPIMNDIDVKFYWFWIPYRVIYRKFRKLISNGDGTIAINDPKAMESKVDMPFVTAFDLIYRGNHSLTSFYRYWNSIRPVIQEGNLTVRANDYSEVADINFTHGMSAGSLADHLGIPCMVTSGQVTGSNPLWFQTDPYKHDFLPWFALRDNKNTQTEIPSLTFNSLPFRAYNKIWFDWFRDENVFADVNSTPIVVDRFDTSSQKWIIEQDDTHKLMLFDEETEFYNSSRADYGSWDNQLNVGLLKKCWTKDYFTSSLLSPQRGQDVVLPLGNSAPVTFKFNQADVVNAEDSYVGTAEVEIRSVDGKNQLRIVNSGNNKGASIDNSANLSVDLSQASSATLNSLRVANAMQRFCEKLARCGSRYVEQMQAMFDVEVPDAVSERCSLLSTSRCPVQVSTNTSTADTEIAGTFTPQGTQAANATGTDKNGFRFTSNEHGLIMGIMCIEPRVFYGSCLSRDWYQFDWLDYAWPSFANLGEQEVRSSELTPNVVIGFGHDNPKNLSDYPSSVANGNLFQMDTFGYQTRYCEYKYKNDEIHGRFKTDLQYYHLSRFPNDLTMPSRKVDEAFLLCNSEDHQNIFHEVLNTENGLTTDHFLFDFDFNFKGIRPLPLYGTPTL